MSVFLVLGLLGAVYLAINLALPLLPVSTLVRTYFLQPVIWCSVILVVRFLPPYRPQAKISTRNGFVLLALGIAFTQVVLYGIGGLFSGFGQNPASRTLLGITENIFFVGAMLTGMELSRSWLVNRLGKRHSFMALTLTALFFTFISIPLSQVTGFKLQIESTNLVNSSWVPLLAENLLASLLVFIAGARASLACRGLLAAFWWLCPVLPDLSWGLKALIGAGVPIMGMALVYNEYSAQANRGKPKMKNRRAAFPAGLVVTALACVAIAWFAAGVFPFQPTLVGSGSMSPALDTGDVVIVAKAPAGSLKVGDIIEFRQDERTNIIHRVIGFDDAGGKAAYITKGDANTAPDVDGVIPENVIGKVVFNVPKIGMISIIVKNLFRSGL
jgi:signal peptidase